MPCGVGDYTYHLAHALSLKGVDVHVLTGADARLLTEHTQTASIHVHPVVPGWSLRSLPIVGRVIRQVSPTVVHIQYPAKYGRANRSPTANLLSLCAKMAVARVPVVTTLHEFGERSLLWRTRAVLNVLTSDAVICVNRYDVDRVTRIAPARRTVFHVPLASNVPVVPLDHTYRANVRLSLGIGPDDIVIAYFGFITPLKGFETLLLTVQRMLKASLPVKLLILGQLSPESNSYHRQISERIDQLGIRNACLLGNAFLSPEDVSRYLQASEMAILPFVEGASDRRGSLIACLSHGLPVITTTGPDTPPEFESENSMLLVPPEDPAATTTAAIRLAKDPCFTSHIAAGARRLGVQFAWDEVARRTIEIYDALQASSHVRTMHAPTDQETPKT